MNKVSKLKASGNRYKDNPNCPCGKSNRDGKFVSFEGLEGKGKGYCHSCAETFWDDNQSIIDPTAFKKMELPAFCNEDINDLEKHLDVKLESSFAKYLQSVVGWKVAVEIVERYCLGKFDPTIVGQTDRVIFWQLDDDFNLKAGKVMEYSDKGKRIGNPTWWRAIHKKDCQMNMCFFGQHLIAEVRKPIAIVESEKTACFMSYFNPSYTWLASGGKGYLQDNKCSSIAKYDVTLFPDHDAYDKWKETADKWDFKISKDCEHWFEQGLISEGDDIADYYLNLATSLNSFIVEVDYNWNQEEYEAFKIASSPNYVSDIRTGRFPYFKKS